MVEEARSNRGFAGMEPDKQRQIASKGGQASGGRNLENVDRSAAGRKGGQAVARNREHMAEIGRKGGQAVARNREHMANIGRKGGEAVSRDREHMAEIGRRGGEASGGRREMGEENV